MTNATSNRWRRWLFTLAVCAAPMLAAAPGEGWAQQAAAGAAPAKPFKILHVMSYHTPWRWTELQLEGFKEGLGGLPAEIKVFEMDTYRNSSKEWMERKGEEARRVIEAWQPDLLYTTDDAAQKLVASHYVNTALPIVYSGVNAAPEQYGFAGTSNVTGVLELEHFTQSVKLLRRIVPTARKVAVIIDEGPTWPGVVGRMRARLPEVPEIEIVAWDKPRTFDEYKATVLGYHGKADALALLGIFTFKDADGRNVPYQQVLKWTAENSKLPDFSFWRDRVDHGTLASVTVSEYEQGFPAGVMARRILTGEGKPSEMTATREARGISIVSLARAQRIGIAIPAPVLLSSEVVRDFKWDR